MSTTFRYVAVDPQGRRVRGTTAAVDEQDAYRRIAGGGMTPVRVRQQVARSLRVGRPITRSDLAAMTREMSVLVQARMPLSTGLAIMAQNERNASMARLLRELSGSIEAGSRISDAIEQRRDVFGDVYVATMRAAESSGMLAEITVHLADMLDGEVGMQQRLRRAATYPAIVLAVVSAALFVIVGFVVPRFAATYASSGVDLPLATRVVQAVGASLRTWWWVYLGAGGVGLTALLQAWNTSKGRLRIEEVLSRTPYIGRLLTAVSTSRFCRVLSISSSAGLDLIESVEMSAGASGSLRVQTEMRRLGGKLRGGSSLFEVLQTCTTLPPFARRLLGSCKDSGDVTRTSDVISSHFDREGRHLAESVSSVIEPLMTVLLAFIVLVVALSVFLPMWQLVGLSR